MHIMLPTPTAQVGFGLMRRERHMYVMTLRGVVRITHDIPRIYALVCSLLSQKTTVASDCLIGPPCEKPL